MSKYKDKDSGVALVSFNAKWVSWAHTCVAYTAFLSALVVGVSLHFHKIVKNQYYGYPDEWFPSVSATIGDRYPERSFFMVFIAITSGPRFALVALWYLLTARPGKTLPKFVAAMGIFRTLTCGGWTYVTSTDDHDWHDIFMISYLVATIPWTAGCLALSPPNPKAIKYRKYIATAFFTTIIPMVYFFIQHKVHRVAGAYTTYSFFEWSLILYDVAFDAVTALDFDTFEIIIKDVNGLSKGRTTYRSGSLSISLCHDRDENVDSRRWADVGNKIDSCKCHAIQLWAAERPGTAQTMVYGCGYPSFVFDNITCLIWCKALAIDLVGYTIGINDPIPKAAIIEGFEIHWNQVSTSPSEWNSSRQSTVVLEKEKGKATAGIANTRFSWSELFDTTADVYHGYVFWSMLTSMGILIWYFPLWHMGISGYEAFILSTISPLFLGIKSFRTLVPRNLRLFHLLSLSGILAWKVTDPAYRLFAVGFGVSMSCLAWAATLFNESTHEARLESKLLAWMAGLALSSAMKFAWRTNNPIWPIMNADNGGYNSFGLGLAVLATLWFTRHVPLTGGRPTDGGKSGSPFLAALGHHDPLGMGRLSVSTWTVFGAGCMGATILTRHANWFGYYGALVVAFYFTAISIPFLTAASQRRPAVTFGLGFLIYNFLVLFHVWVVAYAFVPGGPLVRERTDWIMITTMLLVGAGVFNLTSQNARSHKTQQPVAQNRHRKYYAFALGAINIFFLITAYLRFPTNDYKPYHEESRVMTAGIWTIHFSLDNDMWSSEYRMRDLIKELEIDVIGLLESDLQRIIMGNRDTTQILAEELGMYVDYGPGPNKHTWGAALLSKFPIVNSTHHLLPSPVGELAPAIHATLDMYGELVDVFVFHSGQEEDPEDRRLQSEYLSKLMGSSPRPSVLLSYLVTKPLKGNYNTYVSQTSGMHDVDPSDWDRWCEYILYKHLQRVGYARVSRSTITDTELQVAKFVIPTTSDEKEKIAAMNDDADTRNRRAKENEVPEGWRFPAMFRGRGVRGHRYHVFNEPRYYKP
ncbi:hypothetical protein EKO27_g6884 [Xylaria grammica]|uniref:Calcofluor white hypersensitive protein n=1 Tax=Xylaria grammica TaxID=363999 RepID=A0A439D1C3_9PEZI|nr:hypothetical protein EKO27_g6884 [Xylaria grammica]